MKFMRSLSACVIFITCLTIVSCGRNVSEPSHPTKTEVVWRNGSKIVIQPLQAKNETHFYQSEIKITPSITINSQEVGGQHSFEFDSMAFYPNYSPPPKVVTFTVLHNTPIKAGWKFPPKAQLIVIADGNKFELPHCKEFVSLNQPDTKCYQNELTKDLPSDPEFYETLIMDMPFDIFSAMAKAKSVRMHIGKAQFTLPTETIAAFNSFAEVVSQ